MAIKSNVTPKPSANTQRERGATMIEYTLATSFMALMIAALPVGQLGAPMSAMTAALQSQDFQRPNNVLGGGTTGSQERPCVLPNSGSMANDPNGQQTLCPAQTGGAAGNGTPGNGSNSNPGGPG